jgi:carboxyl-terminal processing protease
VGRPGHLKAQLSAAAIIIDVRGNGGGSTPETLHSVLMAQPYQGWSEATPERLGALEIYQDVGSQPTLLWKAPVQTPAETHYSGKVLILADVRCFSDCDGFVEPFEVNHRATIIGEHTAGSTGQPYAGVDPPPARARATNLDRNVRNSATRR